MHNQERGTAMKNVKELSDKEEQMLKDLQARKKAQQRAKKDNEKWLREHKEEVLKLYGISNQKPLENMSVSERLQGLKKSDILRYIQVTETPNEIIQKLKTIECNMDDLKSYIERVDGMTLRRLLKPVQTNNFQDKMNTLR